MAAHTNRRPQNGTPGVALAVGLGLLLLFVTIAWAQYEPYTFLHGDGAFYANINKSLWHDGSLDQGPYHPHSWLETDLGWNQDIDQGWSNVSLGADGRWLPKHSFVMPLFATPFYAVLGLNGLLAFHILMLVLLCVSAFQVARTALPDAIAALATFALAAQPIISGDVYSYNNDAFYSAMLLAGTWAYLRQRLSTAGLLFGIAVWAKATSILYVAPFGLHLLWTQLVLRRDLRTVLAAALPFSAFIGAFLLSNLSLFGGPLTSSYDRIIVRHQGALQLESISERFHEKPAENLPKVFKDSRQGLVPRAPLMLLAAFGAALLLWRRQTAFLGAAYLGILIAFVALHAYYHYIYARFFLPVAGLSVAPLGALLYGVGRLVTHPRLRALLAPRYQGRLNPVFFAAIALALAALFWLQSVAWPTTGAAWRLTDHVQHAHVTQGREPCDYFNNMHQKFECHSDLRSGPGTMWGRAVGQEQCRFQDQPRRMLWVHPPPRASSRSLEIGDLPGGELTLQYGLDQTSRFDNVRFEVRIDGKRLKLPGVSRKDALITTTTGLGPGPHRLQLKVFGRPRSWRHLCFEATVQ